MIATLGNKTPNLTCMTRGIINTFGTYQDYYKSEILEHETSSVISWNGTLQGFLLLMIGIVMGLMFDRGYVRHLIITGIFLVGVGLIMTGLYK